MYSCYIEKAGKFWVVKLEDGTILWYTESHPQALVFREAYQETRSVLWSKKAVLRHA